MGGGLAATLVSARMLNSKGKRLIDYDLVLLTLPMMISGSILGVPLTNPDHPQPLHIVKTGYNYLHRPDGAPDKIYLQ